MATTSERVAEHHSQSTPTKPRRAPWLRALFQVSIGLLVLALVAGALLYMSHLQTMRAMKEVDFRFQRNFRLMPFDLIDATFYCIARTEAKYGEQLALSYVDDHSTRVDPHSGVYKIFMTAHVGTLEEYEETAVHCHVDPHKKMLTQYRTINIENASVMARALKFFQ